MSSMLSSVVASRRPTAADLGFAAVLVGALVAEHSLWAVGNTGGLRFAAAPFLVLAAVLAGAALARRAVPGLAPLVPAALMGWLGAVQPAALTPFMFAAAVAAAVLGYRAGTAGHRATGWGLSGLALAGAGLAAVVGNPDGALFVPVVLVIFSVLPWLVGRYRRQQRALVRAGQQRIAQLEREQHIAAEQARLRERAALAEEMHDSLGHELSLIALRAGGLELSPDLPSPHRAAVGELRAATAAATGRLAEIVTVLRDGPPSDQPATGPVADLVDRVRGSGLAVELTQTGQPTPEVAATVHRVVQEGLTNAAKHAPGAAVTVVVASDDAGSTVTVTNPAPARADPPDPPDPPGSAGTAGTGGGHGLATLHERVRLLGGELSVSRPAGGFTLTVRLPHRLRAGLPGVPQ